MSAATYETHPLASAINQISGWESLQNFHEPSIATSEQYSNARDKIFSFALALKSLLDSTPYTLISSHGLSQIHAHLQHSINEVANFVANNNPAHLVNAAAHLDQTVVPLVGQYFAFSKITNPLLPAELIEKVKESANSTIKILNEQRNSALLELESLRASISTEHASLAQLAELVAQNKNEAMAINAKIQHDFAEHETRRNSAFTDKMVEIAEGAEFDRNHHKESAKKTLAQLTQMEQDAKRIVQVVGNIGVTGNFQRIANKESEQADFWRWATIVMFGIGIFFAAVTFFKFLTSEPTPENLWSSAVRLLYAIAITAPAWYAAKESARHRSNADLARQTELELASLGPFIELMPDDKKNSIRESLIEKYFGNGISPHKVQPMGAELKDVAIEAIRAIKK